MARPATKPPSKLLGIYVDKALIAEIDRVIADRGINKREFFEAAARQEITSPTVRNGRTEQEELPIGA